MAKTILRWSLIAALIGFSSIVYVEIQGDMTLRVAFPLIKAFTVRSKASLGFIFTTCNLLSALITASVTALPCGYLAGSRVNAVTALLLLALLSFPTLVFFQDGKLGTFVSLIFMGQVLTTVFSVIALVQIGAYIREKRKSE
jgi:hypothetical protein